MNIEQKNRLIALCNNMKSYGYTDGVEELESIFPQLRESEDERIRKSIIDALYSHTNSINILSSKGYSMDDVIAYLEKQKEEKLDSIRIKCKEHDERREEIRVTEIIESIIRVYGKTQGEFIAGYDIDTLIHWVREAFDCLNKQNIQKEQKPAEWSPNNEDVVLFNKAVTTNTNLTPSERAKLDIIRMKFKHCNRNITKPAEWSEHQHKLLNYAISITEDAEVKSFLESLRNTSPKVEWSEEGEPKKPDKFPGITRFCNVADNLTRIASGEQTTEVLEGERMQPTERATMQDFNYHDGEPDKKAWSRLIAILNYAEATSDDTPGEEVQALINWIDEKQKEQKPLEWSEEDEDKLEQCIRIVSGWEVDYDIVKLPYSNFLKSLRPQLKQEWSEEDKKDIAHIIRILDDCYAYEKHDLSKTDHDNLVNKLKTLRPSWRPSEEQMEAFAEALARLTSQDMDNRTYANLCELKSNLKKLM